MAGVFNSGKQSLAEVKFVNIGHREPLFLGLTQQYEAGGWSDSAGNGRHGSIYGAYLVGVEAGANAIARAMAGPAIIATPDSYLGGPIAFSEEFFVGFKSNSGNVVGVMYKHISNAGLYTQNMGRDFAGVQAGITF